MLKLVNTSESKNHISQIVLAHKDTDLSGLPIDDRERGFIKQQIENDATSIWINQYEKHIFIAIIKTDDTATWQNELARRSAVEATSQANKLKITECSISNLTGNNTLVYPFCEGMMLSNYQFLKYQKEAENKKHALSTVYLHETDLSANERIELQTIAEVVCLARDLVNEPLSGLNAKQLAQTAVDQAKDTGLQVEVFDKKRIEELKMGGLLAVNKGSIDPPTFTSMTWNPANAKNADPIVLVGKGVVFDTGGLSLKPTPNSMDYMKADMGGAAVVMAVMLAIARLNIPVHVKAFLPATDNRPDGNAYVPGDIITMYDGTTVEVKNTDAEGRLIMADALAYANQYNPQLMFTVATLTGSAAMALGPYSLVGMGNMSKSTREKLCESGQKTHEPVTFFPFFEEYGKSLKSDVADISNLGSREGGAISAGKFLEHFADHPFVHLDIAGVLYTHKTIDYKPKGGTAMGVRLLVDYLKSF